MILWCDNVCTLQTKYVTICVLHSIYDLNSETVKFNFRPTEYILNKIIKSTGEWLNPSCCLILHMHKHSFITTQYTIILLFLYY